MLTQHLPLPVLRHGVGEGAVVLGDEVQGKAVVGPGAKLELADLFVEGEVLYVDAAVGPDQ